MEKKTLHRNNFDFLRLLFALMVIFTHSIHVADYGAEDFLGNATNLQVSISYIGVRGFFVISGYLIYQSLVRSKDLIDYYWKRVLRLFPALFVMLVLCLLLGPFVYESTIPYWQNHQVLTYLPNNMALYLVQHQVNGVFSHNYSKAVNGSLWTICYEFTCYMGLSVFIFVRKWANLSKVLLVLAFLTVALGTIFFENELDEHAFFISFGRLFGLAAYFLGGTMLAVFKFEKFKYIPAAVIISAVVMTVAVILGIFHKGFNFAFLPFFVIGLGVQSTPGLNTIGEKIGDLSYGLYIYGFPVQQTLEYFYRPSIFAMVVWSMLITSVLAFASWHLVEKRALKWKKYRPTAWIERLLHMGLGLVVNLVAGLALPLQKSMLRRVIIGLLSKAMPAYDCQPIDHPSARRYITSERNTYFVPLVTGQPSCFCSWMKHSAIPACGRMLTVSNAVSPPSKSAFK